MKKSPFPLFCFLVFVWGCGSTTTSTDTGGSSSTTNQPSNSSGTTSAGGSSDSGSNNNTNSPNVTGAPSDSPTTSTNTGATTNRAPIISNFNNVVVDEGQTITFNPTISDEDEDSVTQIYSGWMTSNIKVTGFSDFGVHSVTLTVSDGTVSVSQTITATVNDMNSSPVISGVSNMTVNESDLITLNPVVSDVDGEQVSISYSGWMTSNTRQTTYTDAGVHEVTITASDNSATSTRTIQITVENVNRAPVLTAFPQYNMDEGKYLAVPIIARDPDENSLAYSIVEPLPANMVFHTDSNAITFEPTADQSGTYTLTVTATDNGTPNLLSSQILTITVNNTLNGNAQGWNIIQLSDSSCNCAPKIDAGIVFYCSGGEIYKYESDVTTKVSPDGVVDNVGGRPCPQTHNGRADWSANGRVYYYDGIETNDVGGGYGPRLYGTNVVWSNGARNSDIYFYDGITEVTSRLTDNSLSDSTRDIVPNIFNDRLVWVRYTGSGIGNRNLIYYFDGEEHVIASDVSGDTPPSIGPNMISWVGNWGAGDAREYDIFAYDGNQILQITNDSIWDGNPYVTATDDIVWAEHFSPNRLLRYTNGITSVEDEGGSTVNPVMENNVYAWRRGIGSWEIAVKKNNSISSLISYEFATPGDPDTDGTGVVWHLQGGGVYLARPR